MSECSKRQPCMGLGQIIRRTTVMMAWSKNELTSSTQLPFFWKNASWSSMNNQQDVSQAQIWAGLHHTIIMLLIIQWWSTTNIWGLQCQPCVNPGAFQSFCAFERIQIVTVWFYCLFGSFILILSFVFRSAKRHVLNSRSAKLDNDRFILGKTWVD